MLQDLHLHLAAVPGLALRAQRLQDAYKANDLAPFTVDPQLATVVGPEPRWRLDEAYIKGRDAKLRTVAAEFTVLNAAVGVTRIIELAEQAQLADPSNDIHRLAQLVGEHVADPLAWLEEAQKTTTNLLLMPH
jgi:hypothetical protein